MPCCGKKREQFLAQGATSSPLGLPARPHPQFAQPPKVVFQYSGRTAMVVIGPISGTRYRFQGPGGRVEVDPRDRRSLAVVPNLRQVALL
jgi:hypothetical protein